jgi:hypothetical protein
VGAFDEKKTEVKNLVQVYSTFKAGRLDTLLRNAAKKYHSSLYFAAMSALLYS